MGRAAPGELVGRRAAAIRGVLAQAEGIAASEIAGIGLSGQMHGLVLLDEADKVIRPALIWCDQRSQPQVDAINRTVGRKATVLDYTANPVLTGFTLPKLLWVRDNEPQLFARVRKMLLPKDYVRFQLTGEYASDVSDASGTALFDVVHRRWSMRHDGRAGPRPRRFCRTCYESTRRHRASITRAAAEAHRARGGHAGGGGRRAIRQPARWATASWSRALSPARSALRAWCSRIMQKPGLRSRRPRPHLLPCGRGHVARDGRDAGRGAEPAMVPQPTGARTQITTRSPRRPPPAPLARRGCSGCPT